MTRQSDIRQAQKPAGIRIPELSESATDSEIFAVLELLALKEKEIAAKRKELLECAKGIEEQFDAGAALAKRPIREEQILSRLSRTQAELEKAEHGLTDGKLISEI